jgi:hypothetical protein
VNGCGKSKRAVLREYCRIELIRISSLRPRNSYL